MKVRIPSPLLSYTNQREVEAEGSTLDALVTDLDRDLDLSHFYGCPSACRP